jgi:hypothetical protein
MIDKIRNFLKSDILIIGIAFALLLSSCGVLNHTAKDNEVDDRYYNLTDASKEHRQLKKLYKNEVQSVLDSTSSSVARCFIDNDDINYHFDMDDYYDFQYASRMRRFYRPMNRWGYFDPFYTNIFWYDPNPLFFGNSIYSTYAFWNPHSPWEWNSWGMGLGFNMGFGMSPMFNSFYNPWTWNFNHPWCGWGSPWSFNPWVYHNPFLWGAPMSGFGIGYMQGFNQGFASAMFFNNMSNPMHFNSFDSNTFVSVPNTGGLNGGGFGFVALNQSFSQTIGTSTSSFRIADVGVQSVKGTSTSLSQSGALRNKQQTVREATLPRQINDGRIPSDNGVPSSKVRGIRANEVPTNYISTVPQQPSNSQQNSTQFNQQRNSSTQIQNRSNVPQSRPNNYYKTPQRQTSPRYTPQAPTIYRSPSPSRSPSMSSPSSSRSDSSPTRR